MMTMRSRLAALLALALAATTPLFVPSSTALADETVTVQVNTRAGLEIVSDTAVGVNHAIWDSQLGTDTVADLMKDAGVQMMRYPGGSYSDIYHWRDHTAPGGYVAPDTDFDHFMAGVRRAGAQPIVTANYGTGSPQEAADWVRHANVEKGYGVKYWEIGNENYGNGHYGAQWEADDHADKSPAGYATLVKEHVAAMKAADPTIKIGAVLTTAGDWPDGIVAGDDAGSWNQVVLSIAGPVVDFVILHWYPSGANGPEVLSKTVQISEALWLTRQQIARYAGKDLGIAVTELNVPHGRNTQPGALFAADAYATYLEQGVFTVNWWNVHNGIGTVSTIDGQTDYEDFGLLSSANCLADGVTCQPPMNTPFAPYYALSMVSKFAKPGNQLVKASASDPLVKVHAARRANGELAVLVINQDTAAAKALNLRYAGYSPAATASVLTFTNGASEITTSSGSATAVTVPPNSLTTIVARPSAAITGPAAPGRPTASAVTDRTATITWPAGPSGVKYEVHRQNGTNTEQWGETTGTSFTVHNLVPGTRYTANVIARDGAGRVSWASPPVTFQTGSPATSACAVKFAETTNWGNGYVASVDITNTGTSQIDSWNLAFRWPTAWQRMDGGWNGTWTQTGNAVAVSNADFNRTLAPGATANIGFVGGYAGPNVPVALFTLNGVLCTTR
jgi:hypothetical protein